MSARGQPARRLPALLAALVLALGGGLAKAPLAGEPVELELVLAVDVSSSITFPEYKLQRQGIADALGDPEVLAAIERLQGAGLALTVVQWAGFGQQERSLPWSLVREPADARDVARLVRGMPRAFVWGQTRIGDAIGFATLELFGNAFEGRRRVIDVSGDGGPEYGPPPRHYRDLAVVAGITINGLAILTDRPDLAAFYQEHVIAGPEAFVLSAASLENFREAMVRKLLREIEGVPLAAIDRPEPPERPG